MTRITIAKGDGIGPEIMEATLSILEAAGAELAYDEIEIGEKVYLAGNTAGISPEAWDTIRRNKVFLKAPKPSFWLFHLAPICIFVTLAGILTVFDI